jgi:hypothetical protein
MPRDNRLFQHENEIRFLSNGAPILLNVAYFPKDRHVAERSLRSKPAPIDTEVANDLHSTANAAVSAGFAGLPTAERFIGNLEINKAFLNDFR